MEEAWGLVEDFERTENEMPIRRRSGDARWAAGASDQGQQGEIRDRDARAELPA